MVRGTRPCPSIPASPTSHLAARTPLLPRPDPLLGNRNSGSERCGVLAAGGGRAEKPERWGSRAPPPGVVRDSLLGRRSGKKGAEAVSAPGTRGTLKVRNESRGPGSFV